MALHFEQSGAMRHSSRRAEHTDRQREYQAFSPSNTTNGKTGFCNDVYSDDDEPEYVARNVVANHIMPYADVIPLNWKWSFGSEKINISGAHAIVG